jgi:hypothetical protein
VDDSPTQPSLFFPLSLSFIPPVRFGDVNETET